MKKLNLFMVAATLVATFTSCASVTLLNQTYPEREKGSLIDVYYSNRPKGEYHEIALIKCEDISDQKTMERVKKEARKVGADAVVITGSAVERTNKSTKTTNSSSSRESSTTYTKEESGMSAVAIKYKK